MDKLGFDYSDGTPWDYPRLSYWSQVVHWNRMDSWDLSYQWWNPLGLSQVTLPIPSGTLGRDGQLGFELSVMRPLGFIPGSPTNPKCYTGMGWTVGIWFISVMGLLEIIPGFPTNPNWYIGIGLPYRSQVVHWDGMDSWDLSYQWWDHFPTDSKWYIGTGLKVMILQLSVTGLWGIIPVHSNCTRWYTRINKIPLEISWQ